jgi:hypothetical protein
MSPDPLLHFHIVFPMCISVSKCPCFIWYQSCWISTPLYFSMTSSYLATSARALFPSKVTGGLDFDLCNSGIHNWPLLGYN